MDLSKTEAQVPANEGNRESKATANRRGRKDTQATAKGQQQSKEGAVGGAREGDEVINDKRSMAPAFGHIELAVTCKHIPWRRESVRRSRDWRGWVGGL